MPRRWSATGSRSSGAGWSAAAWPRCSPGCPGRRVELVDVDPARAGVAAALGVGFAAPDDAAGDCDLVVHASATDAGLARSLELLADEGEVIELSWYGDRRVTLPLGEDFHSRRLAIRAARSARSRRPGAGAAATPTGMALALRLLADPVFDTLVTDGKSGSRNCPG